MSISAYAKIPPPLDVVKLATLAVADCPVNPIVISVGLIDPTLAVADTPVKPIDIAVGLIDPTLAVAETPVRVPTEVVAETPLGKSIHAKPNDPTEAVAAWPDNP